MLKSNKKEFKKMEEKKFENLSEIINASCQTLFGFKRNGQPLSVLDVAAKKPEVNLEKKELKKKDKKKKKKDKKKNKKK